MIFIILVYIQTTDGDAVHFSRGRGGEKKHNFIVKHVWQSCQFNKAYHDPEMSIWQACVFSVLIVSRVDLTRGMNEVNSE